MQDVLVLGDYVFDEWSTPEKLPAGGHHKVSVTNFAGGGRVVDMWGPEDPPRELYGIIRGDFAEDDAAMIDQMRIAGEELEYSNGVEVRTVVIEDFTYWVRRGYVEYQLRLITTDNSGGGDDSSGGSGSIDSTVGSDLGAASDLASSSGTPETQGPNQPRSVPLPPQRPSAAALAGTGA